MARSSLDGVSNQTFPQVASGRSMRQKYIQSAAPQMLANVPPVELVICGTPQRVRYLAP